MKYILSLILFTVCFIGVCFMYRYWADLNYLSQHMIWNSKASSWFKTTMQIARTRDTNQLVLRQVDRDKHLAVFVSTTMDNRFDILLLVKQQCESNKTYPAILDAGKSERVIFQCDPESGVLSFRRVWKRPVPFQMIFNNQIIYFKPDEWDLALLKKDQFMQLHARFFKNKNSADVHEWRRD